MFLVMDKPKAKKQHYVPRFYLRGFTSEENQNKLFVYNKEEMVHFYTNIENIAQENLFYDPTEEQLIEKLNKPTTLIIIWI